MDCYPTPAISAWPNLTLHLEWSLMETFHENYPDKYDFLFKRGGKEDTVIFQGSAGDDLIIYGIKDRKGKFWPNLKHTRMWDYDVMSVRNDIVVLDEDTHYIPAVLCHLAGNANLYGGAKAKGTIFEQSINCRSK